MKAADLRTPSVHTHMPLIRGFFARTFHHTYTALNDVLREPKKVFEFNQDELRQVRTFED